MLRKRLIVFICLGALVVFGVCFSMWRFQRQWDEGIYIREVSGCIQDRHKRDGVWLTSIDDVEKELISQSAPYVVLNTHRSARPELTIVSKDSDHLTAKVRFRWFGGGIHWFRVRNDGTHRFW